MCLALRGCILAVNCRPPGSAGSQDAAHDAAEDPLWRLAEVDFGGVRQWVSLACLPQAQVGDQVLVHVGLAIALVEEQAEMPQASDPEAEPAPAPGAASATPPSCVPGQA
jgi:hydrogenase expression/formation protein HypC